MSTNISIYCDNNPISNIDNNGALYIKAKDVRRYVNFAKDALRAFNWSGGWKLLASLISPYLGLITSWIQAIPVIGWVIFAYILYNAAKIAVGIAQAYVWYTGIEFWVSWGFVKYRVG